MANLPKAVVVTDAVSAGLVICDEARKRGYQIIIYLSQPVSFFEDLPISYQPPYLKDPKFYNHLVVDEDLDSGLEKLKRLNVNICAVIAGSDCGVISADTLAYKLGLRCNDPNLIQARRNKFEMKRAVEKAGLRVAKHASCKSRDQLDAFIEETGFPVVLKHPYGACMYQLAICNNRKEAHKGFDDIFGKSDAHGSISTFVNVEEYIQGVEYAFDSFADGENIFVTDVWRYNRVDTKEAKNQYRDIYMVPIDDPLLDTARQYAVDICKVLGVKYGATHPEIKIDDKGPVMMEVGCRLAGCKMPHMCRDLSNFDPLSSTVDIFCGMPLNFERPVKYHGFAWIVFCGTEERGEISAFEGFEEILKVQSYNSHFLTYKVGDHISPTTDLWNNPLYVWLTHKDPQVLKRDAELVHNLFKVKTR